MTLRNYPPIRCSRCDSNRIDLTKCKKPDCDFETYRDAITRQFPVRPPIKYYCTISGAANAGKTFYLITLIHLLIEEPKTKKYLRRYGIKSISFADPISSGYYKSFLNDSRNGQLQLTLPTQPLSFFNLIIHRTNHKQPPIELVLFNTAGETFEDRTYNNDLRAMDHDLRGIAMLHFVDPRDDSSLNDLLLKPKGETHQCKDLDIIDYLYRLHQSSKHGVQYLNFPLGICVSKFDLLNHTIPQYLPEDIYVSISSLSLFHDINKSSKELQAFLDKNSKTIDPYLLIERHTQERLRYFSVSSFGSDDTPIWSNRKPKGVLAPFIWMLKELRIINDI